MRVSLPIAPEAGFKGLHKLSFTVTHQDQPIDKLCRYFVVRIVDSLVSIDDSPGNVHIVVSTDRCIF